MYQVQRANPHPAVMKGEAALVEPTPKNFVEMA